MSEWQFNVLFFVGVGGAVFMLVAPVFGVNALDSPNAVMGIGAILAFVLSQKKNITKSDDHSGDDHRPKGGDSGD